MTSLPRISVDTSLQRAPVRSHRVPCIRRQHQACRRRPAALPPLVQVGHEPRAARSCMAPQSSDPRCARPPALAGAAGGCPVAAPWPPGGVCRQHPGVCRRHKSAAEGAHLVWGGDLLGPGQPELRWCDPPPPAQRKPAATAARAASARNGLAACGVDCPGRVVPEALPGRCSGQACQQHTHWLAPPQPACAPACALQHLELAATCWWCFTSYSGRW